MNILLIGGLGNIGAPVTKALVSLGHSVVVVGRRPSAFHPEDFRYQSGDTADVDFLTRLQKEHQFDVVINFAIQTTLQAEANIQAFAGHIKQFIFISTVTVLNRETQVVLSERSECGNPYSTYAQSKFSCEQRFMVAHKKTGFPVTVVRPSQTYSHEKFPLSVKGRSYWSVFDRILKGKPVIVHGDGSSTWVSMHSDDFARFFVPLVGNTTTFGEIYHITSDEILTWNMIYREIGNQVDRPVNITHVTTDQLIQSQQYDFKTSLQGDKQYSVIFDLQKIRDIASGIRCEISLSRGLSRYLAHMAQHPELKITDPMFDIWCDNVIERGVIA
jgi:Nucleoside-diphosphate-sugar epimerases